MIVITAKLAKRVFDAIAQAYGCHNERLKRRPWSKLNASKLIVVRHSLVSVDVGETAHRWSLSAAGRQRCLPLARRLLPYQPTSIYSSLEPKAAETAKLIAPELQLTVRHRPDLRETQRFGVPFMPQAQFDANVARYFAIPDQRVFGGESADEAHARFAGAIERIERQAPAGNIVVVAHGTVISLLVSRRRGTDPYGYWKQLRMPCLDALPRQDWRDQALTFEDRWPAQMR